MNEVKNMILVLVAMIFCACSSGGSGTEPEEPPIPITPPTQNKININISTTVQGLGTEAETSVPASAAGANTRVAGNSFEQGDQVGLFIVNRKSDGSASPLTVSGNHVDNMRFTYGGNWKPDAEIYWADDSTHADFYLYYPYAAGLTTVSSVPFNVQSDQSTETAYKNCDILAGSALNVAPSEQAVAINAHHAMSKVLVVVAPGNGFTSESLSKADVSIKLNNVRTQAVLNIASGEITAGGETSVVKPLKTDEGYVALLPPQTVTDQNLITVTVDGKEYNLKKTVSLKGGWRHKFTVTVSKTSNGVNVNISKWEDDGTDYGGTAE